MSYIFKIFVGELKVISISNNVVLSCVVVVAAMMSKPEINILEQTTSFQLSKRKQKLLTSADTWMKT
jgi:hypothetical protein